MYTANKIETFHPAHRRGHKRSRARWVFFLLISGLFYLVAATNTASAATYYVDAVNGDDNNPGTSIAPWRSLAKARTELSEGDTALLRDGDYGDFTDTFSDDIISGEPYTYTLPSNTLWTTWKADFGHTPVFSKSGGNGIQLGTSYDMRKGAIIFDGIRVEGAVNISGVYGVRINNCEVVGTEPYIGDAKGGIHLKCSGDIAINNCEIHHSNAYGIGAFLGNNNIIISNNEIYDVGGDCISTKSEYRDNLNFLIEGNTLRDNTLWNTTIHADGIQIDGTGNSHTYTNFVIRNNIITNVKSSASIIIDHTLAPDLVIENNLIYNSAQVLISDTVDMIIRNNTFDTSFRLNRNNLGCFVYNNILLGNITLDNPGDITHNFCFTVNEWNDPNGIDYEDVATAKTALFDTGYQLKATAPAVDFYTGVAATEATPVDDILYNMRDNLPDAGCYEYGPSSPSNQPPVADAGPDQTVTDEDSDGEEQVALDGSASRDPDGTIVSFIWSEGGSQIATAINPTVTLSIGEYLITLTVTDDGGLTDTDTVTIKVLKGDEEFGELPTGCYNNVINPLKGEKALIVVELSEQARVKISMYDPRGNKIKELADEEKKAGTHKYYWDGRNDSGNVVGSGLYFVHIQAGDYKKTKKIVVVK